MNSYIINSKSINSNFCLEIVDLKFNKSLKGLKKYSFVKVLKTIYYGYQIAKKVIIKKPDIVYFTICPTGYAFYRDSLYVALLKLMNSKIVFHLHGKGIEENSKKSSIKRYLYKWVFKNTHVICLSDRLSEDIADVHSALPFIVPNGIEVLPKINNITTRLNSAVPRILYLSNYIRSKGILVLIQALKILKDKGFLFSVRLVGAPEDLTIEYLESEIANHNLAGVVEVKGPLYGNDKYTEYKEADIFVFPTYNDVFGLVNLEAMQFSLPVISTFEGSIPDIVIDNETGFLVEPKNAQMLAEKISILLNDKDLRMKMGMKGHERFLNYYTLDHFEKKMNKVFYDISGPQ